MPEADMVAFSTSVSIHRAHGHQARQVVLIVQGKSLKTAAQGHQIPQALDS
jgi:hypothetical protein